MSELADANLVYALLGPEDALHTRAKRHVGARRLVIPCSVGIELLVGAHRRGVELVPFILEVDRLFEVEELDRLLTAARVLDEGSLRGVFDALHAAEAYHRPGRLHTADERLLRSGFPTVPF